MRISSRCNFKQAGYFPNDSMTLIKIIYTLIVYKNIQALYDFLYLVCSFYDKNISRMFRNPSLTNVDLPLRIILVSKDESAERVLFMYPFESEISASSNLL